MALYTYVGNLYKGDNTQILVVPDINNVVRAVKIGQAIDLSPAQLDAIDDAFIFQAGGSVLAPTAVSAGATASSRAVPVYWDPDAQATNVPQLGASYSVPVGGIPKTDLAQDVQSKLDQQLQVAGRTIAFGNMGSTPSVTITETDDRAQVDIYGTLSANAVLTINNLSKVSRCTMRVVVTQDATGNRTLAIKNGTGATTTVAVDTAGGAETFIYCWTENGSNLHVVGPTTQAVVDSGIGDATISGTAGVGNVLTATPPANTSADSYQWYWKDTGANISGATASTYTQQATDVNHQIDCKVAVRPVVTAASTVLVPDPNISFINTALVNTSTSANPNVSKPAGVVAGDIMLATIVTVGGTTFDVNTVPAGWTLIQRTTNSTANTVMLTYWKREGEVNSDAGPFAFQGTASVVYRSRSTAWRRCLATGTPYELFAASGPATFSTAVTLPTKTPTGNGRVYVGIVGHPQASSIDWGASGLTDVAAVSDYAKYAYKVLSGTSATGTFSGTNGASTAKSYHSLLLIPAP